MVDDRREQRPSRQQAQDINGNRKERANGDELIDRNRCQPDQDHNLLSNRHLALRDPHVVRPRSSFRRLCFLSRAYHTPTINQRLPVDACGIREKSRSCQDAAIIFSTAYPQKPLTHAPLFHYNQAAWLCYNDLAAQGYA
jgi:hypothetical protein